MTHEVKRRIEKMIRTNRLSPSLWGWMFQCGILIPYSILCFLAYHCFTSIGSEPEQINWWVIVLSLFGGISILNWKISQLYFDRVKSTLTQRELFALLENLTQENNWTIVSACDTMVEMVDQYGYGLMDQKTIITVIYTPEEVLVNCIIDLHNNSSSRVATSSGGRTTYNNELVINAIKEENKHKIKKIKINEKRQSEYNHSVRATAASYTP